MLREEEELIARLAAELGLWTAFGSIHPLSAPHRPHNCVYIVSDIGELVGRYTKRYSGPAVYGATAPFGVVAPGRRWLSSCKAVGTPGLAVVDLDLGSTDPDIDIALRLARPWRRTASDGLYRCATIAGTLAVMSSPPNDLAWLAHSCTRLASAISIGRSETAARLGAAVRGASVTSRW